MDIFKANPEITPDFILKYISQKEIMEHYLGVSVNFNGGMFCSPLRQDSNPTCTFTWDNGKLLFRDWAEERPHDCFGVVMEKYNVGFYKAQKIVAKDFNLIRNVKEGKVKERDEQVDFKNTGTGSRKKSDIKVKLQSFTKDNIDYLTSYGISSDQCKRFNVFCPKYVWVNDKIKYVQSDKNPALAYYFGTDEEGKQKWKIYFYRKNSGARFLTNTNRINGWVQIPDSDSHLIITKSLKDVICFDIFDIPAIAMQAESQTPYDYIIEEIQQRFDNIISVYDHDRAGITRANVLKDRFDIPYYFIKDDNAKDFSDYIKFYGLEQAQQLTQEILCN